MTPNKESQPVAWLLQRSYNPPKGSESTDGIVTLALRSHLPRRFAALRSTSLAHVTGFASSASAAACICSRSCSVIGISIAAVLRSLGFLGGLPRLISISVNIYRKIPMSTIALPNYSVYNKFRQRKTPMQPWRATLGRAKPAFADSA